MSEEASVFGINPQAETKKDDWRADAFINIYVPGSNGKSRKLHSIPLKNSKPAEAKLIKELQKEGRMEDLVNVMEFSFNLVDAESSGFEF